MTPSAKLFHYQESHEHPPWARCVPLLLIGGGLSVSCLNSNNPVYIAAVAKLSVWTMSTFGAWSCDKSITLGSVAARTYSEMFPDTSL